MGDPQDRDRLAGHYEIGRRDGGSSWHLGARRWKDCAECVESVHRLAAGVTLSPTPPDALSMRLDTIRSAVAAMIDPKSESYDRLTRNGAFRDVLDLIDAAKAMKDTRKTRPELYVDVIDPTPVPDTSECGTHTPCPSGYLAWHDWADKMARTHDCLRCPDCGLWAIWTKKESVK